MSAQITRQQWQQWQNIFGDNPADYAYGSVHSWFAEDGIHPDPATGGYLIKDAVFRALTNR